MIELENVATYLNLAVRRTNQAAGDMAWLTGVVSAYAVGAGQSEETQCLTFGSAMWIANNDDADTTLQRTMLNALGISKPAQLLRHVERYFTRVLNYHMGALAPGGHSAKQDLLLRFNGGGAPAQAAVCPPAGGGACAAYGLASPGPPPSSGIVFVTGNYQSLPGAGVSYHAEQRLLAALGKYLQAKTIVGQVTVGGVKTACNTCDAALQAVQARLAALHEPVRLRYQNALADQHRVAVGLNPNNPPNIHQLDVNHYYV